MGRKNKTQLFQTVDDADFDRTDHVWEKLPDGRWKCLLCGGIVRVGTSPPPSPTPATWVPHTYEIPLCEAERDLVRRQKPSYN